MTPPKISIKCKIVGGRRQQYNLPDEGADSDGSGGPHLHADQYDAVSLLHHGLAIFLRRGRLGRLLALVARRWLAVVLGVVVATHLSELG